MVIYDLSLTNFRNFKNKHFSFSPSLTVICGDNARGKTNLLEAIFCITNGTGFRETREEELISFNNNNCSIKLAFQSKNQRINLQLNLEKKQDGVSKTYYYNQVKKRWGYIKHELNKTILFSPQQLSIITGPPEQRRDYLNKAISFYCDDYRRAVINYENAIKRRNRILESKDDVSKIEDELIFWDGYLEQQSKLIIEKRQSYIDFLNTHQQLDNKWFIVHYQKNVFSRERLKLYRDLQARYRKTVIGPQKDDVQILISDNFSKKEFKELSRYGSRSEQRIGMFWLKWNEILYHQEMFKKKPILLLDDIFSELDQSNKQLILKLIDNYQTILTTAEADLIKLINRPKRIIKL